mmetsp:Transcript_70554/g.228718  ORF Transcript_70554/g.228718 Transcript_70554/m.228718 type:complete len:103 (+) Transcript_70554:1122-1430(+)
MRAFADLRASVSSTHVRRCVGSMADYVKRSIERSPPMMREAGDAAQFVAALGQAAGACRPLKECMGPFISMLPDILQGAPRNSARALQQGFFACGLDGMDMT